MVVLFVGVGEDWEARDVGDLLEGYNGDMLIWIYK